MPLRGGLQYTTAIIMQNKAKMTVMTMPTTVPAVLLEFDLPGVPVAANTPPVGEAADEFDDLVETVDVGASAACIRIVKRRESFCEPSKVTARISPLVVWAGTLEGMSP